MMVPGYALFRLGCILMSSQLVASLDCISDCDCSDDGNIKCHFPELTSLPYNFPPNATILDLADNNIVHVTVGSLNGLDQLEELNVANNNIRIIDQDAFKNGINVEQLNAQENSIRFLPHDVFFDLVNLRQLNLSKNVLETFPNFSKNVKLETLSLSHNKISEIPKDALRDNTNLSEIYLKALDLKSLLRDVFPNDVSNFSVGDFSENRLWTTPDVIREMRNLKKLCLSSNPIKTFDAKDFRPLGVLKTLEMANVGMKEVPGSIFWLPMLEYLDISHNQISGSSLKNIQFSNLLALKLRSNPVEIVADDAFDGIKKLETLDASDCDISIIHDRTFAVLLNLKKLDLSNNKLNSLPKLKENRLLEELYLDNNNIEVLSLDNFRKMERLKLLSIANNSLTGLSSSLLHGALTITTLTLSGNRFESFPEAVASHNLPSLESLDLSSNLLSGGIPLSSVAGLENLHTLNLRGNAISKIIPDTAGFIWSLERLYICENNLTDVENALLDRFPKLLEFTADGNSIVTIFDSAFFYNPLLEKLSLSNNDLINFGHEALYPLLDLKELMLLQNNIERCPDLSQNHNLKIVGLCNNPIGDLKSGALRGPKALESLLLRATGMTLLQEDAFGDISKIKILDIAQNNFSSVPELVQKMSSLETLNLSENPISNISAQSLNGLWNLHEAHLNKMRLSSLDVIEFLLTLPGLRTLCLSGNPWRCDCEMESFTLGVGESYSRVNVEDRSEMTCGTPGIFQGRILDSLDFSDFTHCKASKVVSIQETSALVRLPTFPDYIKKTVSYMSIPGVEKFIHVTKGKRDVMLVRLMPDTKYLVCVSTDHRNELKPSRFDDQDARKSREFTVESCIKFKTLARSYGRPWSRGGFGGALETSQQLLLVYLVLGGIICLSVAITSLASVFWYKRQKATTRRVPAPTESIGSYDADGQLDACDISEENAVETVKETRCIPQRPFKDVRNGRAIEMTSEGGCDNLSFDNDTTPQRTKL